MKSESVELDRAYAQALAKLGLQVEYGREPDGDSVLTVPIQVIRNATTVPLPKSMLATLP